MEGSPLRGRQLMFSGYGPLVAFAIFFALMVYVAPTVPGAALAGQQTDPSSPGAAPGEGTDPETGEVAEGPTGNGEGPQVNAEGSDPDAPTAADGGGTDGAEAADGQQPEGSGAEAATGGGVQPCADRELQVPGDPYSPPCVTFEGDNGGATARGVTEDEIIISARTTDDEGGFQDTLANIAGAEISDSNADVRRTIEALVEYFNERFEFYGREMRVEFYEGQGGGLDETMGRGHEEAQADALTVAEEIGAFAELNGGTEPFGDALATNGVIAMGALHFSEEWHVERRPYTWSGLTDCSTVAQASADWGNVRLRGDNAQYAGDPGFQEQTRKQATVLPENPVYQQCLAAAERFVEEAGFEPPMSINYTLDIGTMSNQAANIVAQLQNNDITTVTCSCDPVMLVFMTSRATEQDYHPEWIVTGTAFSDQDIVGQLMDQEQWSRAMGISYNAAAQPQQATLGYNAYKQVRDDEPAFAVQTLYYTLYMLAIGIQGAGPELTPDTFEQGMFDYPGAFGPAGSWGFGPGNYTAPEDYREIYWDPDEISSFNNEPGAYIETDPGERIRPGEVPDGPPRVPW
jgi:hypothetical protein